MPTMGIGGMRKRVKIRTRNWGEIKRRRGEMENIGEEGPYFFVSPTEFKVPQN